MRLPVPLFVLILAGCPQTPPEGTCELDLEARPCAALETFELGGCTALENAPRDGVHHIQHSFLPTGASSPTTYVFPANLTAETLGGAPMLDRRTDSDAFYLSRLVEAADGGITTRGYAGCTAPEPDRVNGCYVVCVNDTPLQVGTFTARKVERRDGETEANGLTLVAERPLAETTAIDVYVAKNHAYVVGRDGIYVFDVQDPTQPIFRNRVPVPEDLTLNGAWAKDDALYVASAKNGLVVMDISNPALPVQIATLPSVPYNVHTVFVSGDLLIAMSPAQPGETLIYDVTSAQTPQLLSRFIAQGSYSTPTQHPHDGFILENRLYVNHWALGYVVADLTDPSSPVELGRYEYPSATSHANAVARYGDRLIAFEGGEDWGAHLRVLDVTDPANITQIGEYRLREQISIHNFVFDDATRRLYVAHYQEGVRVLDVSTPETPQEIGYFNTWGPAHLGNSFYESAIGIRFPKGPDVTTGGYVYVADTARGLLVFRVP